MDRDYFRLSNESSNDRGRIFRSMRGVSRGPMKSSARERPRRIESDPKVINHNGATRQRGRAS